MVYENTEAFARGLDESDPLRKFRDRFFIPKHEGRETVYLTGNSLGLQPKTVRESICRELDDWAEHGVEGHFRAARPWLSFHEHFPEQLARIVGALPEEVVVMNQLTVNLH